MNWTNHKIKRLAASNQVNLNFNKNEQAYIEVAIVSNNSVATVKLVPATMLFKGIKETELTLIEYRMGIIANNKVHWVSLLDIRFINAIGAFLTLLAQ